MREMQSTQFLSSEDLAMSKDFLENGFIIAPAANLEALDWIKNSFEDLVKDEIGLSDDNSLDILNQIHNKIDMQTLNEFRLSMISKINSLPDFRKKYFEIAKPYLEAIVCNELAMQTKINLSIQLPNDDSSLLPLHADTWSGDSPFEVVVWIPLVDCFKSKSMYILPPNENVKLTNDFLALGGTDSEHLYQTIKDKVNWIEINYGNILIFNQGLPHGNRVNIEQETRWTMNCRFKSLFSPYKDKKLGEFFDPITLRAASVAGINYQYPKLK